ncbi:ARM repeat-containing protein [Patellaria atrata CBS 101060]|uniref:ARM repeat-containing protein n=1 Tax=Patellaria atrata CBS 101060 TaxID=1346257 RepID=A0A9P4S6T3_9PEZI|nr:ARM repeat-containing protein [Patellaria atrata CBS 101060]
MSTLEQTAPTNGTSSNPELDIPKLHALPSEQQELYVLTFSSNLARHVAALDADGASSHQVYIKKELFKLITLSSPAPNKAIRNSIGRSFAGIFTKGDRKLLFESINELIAILNTGKGDKDVKAKHAAIHALGSIFEAAGDSAIGQSSLVSALILRQLKISQTLTGFKSSVFRTLGRIVKGVRGSMDEPVSRDIWKQCRAAASSGKGLLVQANACWCLEQFVQETPFFDNSNDYEKLQSAIWKAMDSGSPKVRHAAASVLAAILVKSYSDSPRQDPLPVVRKPKKPTRRSTIAEGEDEIAERPGSPAPSKPATQLTFGISGLLRELSTQYCKPATSNRARAAIIVCLIKGLRGLGESVVQRNYGEITRHLFNNLLSFPSITQNRYRQLTTRKYVRIVLEDVIGRQLLGESGQLDAAKFLVNDILKDYPQALKERPEPSKQTLTGALSALTSLAKSLGSALSTFSESCREGLLQVLQHPSYTVQVYASSCLRAFVLACPQQLLPVLTICMNSVTRELGLLSGTRKSPRRCVGLANGLSAVLSTTSAQPLYGSVDVNSRVLSQATSLLKSSSSSDLRISSTQIQVAWVLIGGLMSLGPSFVKIHLSQLLLLWKNALPKPLNKDHMVQRNVLELSFLAHVRECALGSILAFLEFNSRLLTTDVTKRLAAMLQNTSLFLNGLPSRKTTDDISQRLSPSLQLHDFDLMVRRRVLQCYTKLINLNPAGSSETLLQTNLLPLALSSFASPDNYAPSSLSTSIATSSATFESIWEIGDNSGFGVTGLIRGFDIKPLPGEQDSKTDHHWVTRGGPEAQVDQTLLSPICGGQEHDSISLYIDTALDSFDQPDPPSTEVVNSAIQLFAVALPVQTPKVQESILEQLSSFLSASSLQRDPARKAAMIVNISLALLSALKVTVKETKSASGEIRGLAVEKAMQELLHGFVINPDPYVRNIAAEALGRICSCSGNAFTTNEVNHIVDHIIANRDPNARAGCALALGCIHSQLGGMAAGFHLKNILSIIMSLCSDPHPTVHFWALDSLSRVADSACLSFSGYVTSTLGMLAQLYVNDSHNTETDSLGSSDLEFDLPSEAVIVRCIDSIINVLGPDLQDQAKARDMIMILISQFQTEGDILVLLETARCQEHMYLYASGHMEFSEYVRKLQHDLQSPSLQIRDMALDGLHNLMRRNAEDVISTAEPGLEEQLWQALNSVPEHDVVRSIVRNWLQQTGLSNTAEWVQRCHVVLTKVMKTPEKVQSESTSKASGFPELQDEEAAGFAAASGTGQEDNAGGANSTQELLKWQVRTFAMDCLSELIATCGRDAASHEDSAAEFALQQRIADVVRIAFSASTAGVASLRIRGLRIIDQVLKIFGKTPDPDFAEAPLLEQYQAQIGSALTPAFAADSSPELAAEAVNVCATFIATGIVTDVDRMGRILKLLVSALDNFSSESETAAIGDLQGLSSNAQVMVKMAVFSAWAELQIASAEQKYLVEVVKPHIARLTPLWLASLREFARLRFEPDISTAAGAASLSGSLDMIYAALNRETLLKFYQDSWLNLVDAIASLIEEDSEFVFDALDGKTDGTTPGVPVKSSDINYRDEPVAFFFVLFGLAFEALVSRTGDSQASKDQTLSILQALKKILRPSVSGHAIYQEVVFTETTDMLDRLVLTEGPPIQAVIVEIARNLCLGHPSARTTSHGPPGEEQLTEDIEQLFELTRIMVLVLSGLVPNLSENRNQAPKFLTDESVNLLTLAVSSLVDAAAIFPSIIKTDLHACILNIFASILATASCQETVIPLSLPILRRFIASLSHGSNRSETSQQLHTTLARFHAILKHAQKRDSDAALPCEKNTLLASTVLLSSASSAFDAADPLIARFIAELADSLDSRMTSKVAASCARSLLLLPKRNATEHAIVAHLLPHLLGFLACPSEVEGLEDARTIIVQALVAWVSSLRELKQVQAAMGVVVPTLVVRAKNDESTRRETGARLLEIAAANQVVFRAAVGAMEEGERKVLEELVKSAAGGLGRKKSEEEREAPTIALKMDF